MSKFNPGDRVRVIGPSYSYRWDHLWKEAIVTPNSGSSQVYTDLPGAGSVYVPENLELVSAVQDMTLIRNQLNFARDDLRRGLVILAYERIESALALMDSK